MYSGHNAPVEKRHSEPRKSAFMEVKKIEKDMGLKEDSLDFDAPFEIQGIWEKQIKQYQLKTKPDLLASLQVGFTQPDEFGAKQVDLFGDKPASFFADEDVNDKDDKDYKDDKEDSVKRKFSQLSNKTDPNDYLQPQEDEQKPTNVAASSTKTSNSG
jgi:hypothetical protein